LNKANPLLINFEDHAFNCRPHQPCIISWFFIIFDSFITFYNKQ
jgi:hypothetical protein